MDADVEDLVAGESKISSVPLPWCTSQSRISTRSAPPSAIACGGADRDRVEQAEAHRPVALGVMTGRPHRAEGEAALAREQPRRRPRRRRRRPASPPPRKPRRRSCPCRACRRPSAQKRSIRSMWAALCTRSSCSRLAGRGLAQLEAGPAGVLQRRLDRADPRRVLGVGAGVVLERGAVAEEEAHRQRRSRGYGTRRASPGPAGHGRATASASAVPRTASFDVAIVGGGAAGLHVALEAAARRRRASRSSRASRWPRARASGPREASPPRSRPTTPPPATPRTRSTPAAASAIPAAVEALVTEAPAAGRDADRLRGRVRPRGGRRAGAGARGRPLGAPHRPRRRRRDRQGDHPLPRRAVAAEQPGSTLLEGALGDRALARRRGLPWRLTDRGPLIAASTVIATGGGAALWSRTTNPWGAVAAGLPSLAHQAGAELAGLELCQFHPTALALPGTPLDGRLITEAVRGEGAVLVDRSGRRFTDELAPRDQVTAAILDRIERRGRRRSRPRPLAGRPRALPLDRGDARARPGSTRQPARSPSPPPPTT